MRLDGPGSCGTSSLDMESRLAWQPNKTADLPTLRHASYASPLNRNPSLGLQVSSSPRFRLKITCQPFSWIPVGRGRLLKAARFRNLRHIILNASAHRNEDLLSGADHGETPRGKLNVDRVLIVGEGVCIAVATAAFTAALTSRGSQDSRLVVSSTTEPLMPRSTSLPIWQSFFLLAALIINAILRARQLQGRKHFRSTANKLAGADSSVEERVRKLEEEVASAVTIIRVLSKQLEKLGVRFRVTRQTLRDPIQEISCLPPRKQQGQNLKHIASFPFYDLSIYEVPGRRGSFLDLEPNASIYVGNQIMLASFPALDSQTQDDEDENVIFTFGRISRREADVDSDLVVAQYLCFPNSSGGAVVSTRGRLIGMHLQAFNAIGSLSHLEVLPQFLLMRLYSPSNGMEEKIHLVMMNLLTRRLESLHALQLAIFNTRVIWEHFFPHLLLKKNFSMQVLLPLSLVRYVTDINEKETDATTLGLR